MAASKAKPKVDLRSPEQWAAVLFPARESAFGVYLHPERWKHAAANARFRWSHEAHAQGAPVQLTRQDYEAAVEAASKGTPAHVPAPTPESSE